LKTLENHLCRCIFLSDDANEIEDTARVTPLVIVPRDELDELVIQGDTRLSIEDGGVVVSVQVGRDNLVLGVTENALKWSLGSRLDGGLDGLVGGWVLQADSKIDNGDVLGWDTESHSGELAVKLWDDLSDGLSGTGGGWDDVGGSGTSSSPVLAGWTIDGLLGGSERVDSGHETLLNTEVVVDDLGQWSETVGGARSVGENVDVGGVLVLVDTDNEHWGISRRSGDDNLLSTTLQVSGGLVLGGEDTGGLDNVIGTSLSPWDVGWVTLLVVLDDLSVDNELVLLVGGDLTLEVAVGGIVLQHVDGVVWLNERIVDGNDLDVIVLNSVTEDNSSDSSETVDSDLSNHFDFLVVMSDKSFCVLLR